MLNQSSELVAEYRYNGQGHRISWHYDVNTDGDVDSDDPIYHFVHDERWRPLATYRHDHPPGSDFDDADKPKERFDEHDADLAWIWHRGQIACSLKSAPSQSRLVQNGRGSSGT